MGSDHTDLTRATEEGDLGAVQELLDAVGDVDERGRLKRTPLMWAAAKGHTEILRLLLERGADLEADNKGKTALMLAAQSGAIECVDLLLDAGADPGRATKAGHTAVSAAYCDHRGATVLRLLDRGAPIGLAFQGTEEELRAWARSEIAEGRR